VESQRLYRELQEHGYIRYDDVPLESSDGRRHEVEFVSNVYAEGDRSVIQCNIRDIGERKLRDAAALREGQMRQRLEGVTLTVREVAHLLNNDLALAVGTLDLLLLRDDPPLPPDALSSVRTALDALDAAAQHLAKFQRVVRVETQPTPVGFALDVERSI